GLWVLLSPMCFSFLIAVLAWVLLTAVIRDPDGRAFVTFMLVLLFTSYGYFILQLEEIPWAAPIAHTLVPFVFLASYLAAVTYLLFRLIPNRRLLTRFLTVLTSILVIWNLAVLFRERIRSYPPEGGVAGADRPASSVRS